MSLTLAITLDTHDLEAWTARVARQFGNALRSAVDQSARAARRDTLQVLSDDLNVPLSRLRSVLPVVRGSTVGNLMATWPAGGNVSMIRGPGGSAFPVGKLGNATGATFVLTGGGSSSLQLKRAFVIRGRNGGQVVMVRTGKGKDAIKAIYAGRASTDMAQPDSAPRKVWTKSAEQNLTLKVTAAVDKVFVGGSVDVLPDALPVSSKAVL